MWRFLCVDARRHIYIRTTELLYVVMKRKPGVRRVCTAVVIICQKTCRKARHPPYVQPRFVLSSSSVRRNGAAMVSTRRVLSTSLSPFSLFLSLSLSLFLSSSPRDPLALAFVPNIPRAYYPSQRVSLSVVLHSTRALTTPSRTENLPPRAGRFTSPAHSFSLTKKCFVQLLSVHDTYSARSIPVGISSFQTNVSRSPFPQVCSSTRIYFEYCINYFLFRTYS